jgi:dolichyl-phosphooligosaccharide-protein glycotransferase
LAAIVAAAVWARCAQWREIFTPDGLELVPSDSHYYVRFALLQLRSFPRFTSFDPFVNFPAGSFQHWPPLHAWLVAASIALSGVARAEWGAAWVGPVVAALETAIIAALAVRFRGGRQAMATTWLYALLPASIWAGAVGNADHHVHEGFIVLAASLCAGRALEKGSVPSAIAAGVVLGLGRLLTPTAFAMVPLVALAWPAATWLPRSRAAAVNPTRTGIYAGLTCVLVLAGSVLLFGRWDSLEYSQLTLFHPLLALCAFSGCLAMVRFLGRPWQAGLLFGLALLCAGILAGQLTKALHHLGRADALLPHIDESSPLLRDPAWAFRLLSVGLLAMPVAMVGGWLSLRAGDVRNTAALISTCALAVAAGLQARFSQSLSGALAALLPLALPAMHSVFRKPGAWRLGAAACWVGGASLAYGLVPRAPDPVPDIVLRSRTGLYWMRDHLPPASPDPLTAAPADYGVASHPLLGNYVMLWAQRPVLATMVSLSPVHDGALALNGRILSATDDESPFQLARTNRIRYVFSVPSDTLIGSDSYDPHRALLGRLADRAAIDEVDPRTTTAHFRMLYESPELRRRVEHGSFARVFEVVEGAVLAGQAHSGERVVAELNMTTNLGRALVYRRAVDADPDGRFALRVAYPCAASGAERYHVRAASNRSTDIFVTDSDVAQGTVVTVGALE